MTDFRQGLVDNPLKSNERIVCLAQKLGETTRYPLNQANQALADLRAGRFEGAAVLLP